MAVIVVEKETQSRSFLELRRDNKKLGQSACEEIEKFLAGSLSNYGESP